MIDSLSRQGYCAVRKEIKSGKEVSSFPDSDKEFPPSFYGDFHTINDSTSKPFNVESYVKGLEKSITLVKNLKDSKDYPPELCDKIIVLLTEEIASTQATRIN